MLKRILIGALAASALALNAPAALAADPEYGCDGFAVRQDEVSGDNYEGAIWGFVADADGDAVSIRCYVTVNGTVATLVAAGDGEGAATAAGRVTFNAEPEDTVLLCAEGAGGSFTFEECFPLTRTMLPPLGVADLIDELVEDLLDVVADLAGTAGGLLCSTLASLSGSYLASQVVISPEGDLYVAHERVFDCPPFGNEFSQ